MGGANGNGAMGAATRALPTDLELDAALEQINEVMRRVVLIGQGVQLFTAPEADPDVEPRPPALEEIGRLYVFIARLADSLNLLNHCCHDIDATALPNLVGMVGAQRLRDSQRPLKEV